MLFLGVPPFIFNTEVRFTKNYCYCFMEKNLVGFFWHFKFFESETYCLVKLTYTFFYELVINGVYIYLLYKNIPKLSCIIKQKNMLNIRMCHLSLPVSMCNQRRMGWMMNQWVEKWLNLEVQSLLTSVKFSFFFYCFWQNSLLLNMFLDYCYIA